MAFDLYVYENNERIGQVENLQSAKWGIFCDNVGEFDIEVSISTIALEMFRVGNLIDKLEYNIINGVKEVYHNLGIINQVEIKDDYEEQLMIIKGTTLEALLGDRVVLGTIEIKTIDDIYNAFELNKRGLNIDFTPMTKSVKDVVSMTFENKSMLEILVEYCEVTETCFKVETDIDTMQHSLRVYKGVDRSDDTSDDYVGAFGDRFGNIGDLSIIDTDEDFKNRCIVKGSDNSIVFVGVTDENIAKEIFIESDIEKEWSFERDTGTLDEYGQPIYEIVEHSYTDEEYKAKLIEQGYKELKEHQKVIDIEASIILSNFIKYGRDFQVGDIVPIVISVYGYTLDVQVHEVIETLDNNGYNIDVNVRKKGGN